MTENQHINYEAEEILLIGAYIWPNDIHENCAFVTPGMFGSERHRRIFEALVFYYGDTQQQPADRLELWDNLAQAGLFEKPMQAKLYFDELDERYPGCLNNLDYAAKTVFELYKQRCVLKINLDIAKAVQGPNGNLGQILAQAKERLHEIEQMDTGAKTPMTMAASAILETHWPEPPWVVEQMLPVGLAFLGGKPKVGKSWLVLQLALSVGTGDHFLGYKVNRGRVLYMALEDSWRRLKGRMSKQGWPDDAEVRFMNLERFSSRIGYLGKGGGPRLAELIRSDVYKLVIIDTQARAFGGGNQFDPEEVVEALSPLQEASIQTGCTVLLVDHMPKLTGQNRDVIVDLYGSVAKVGVADTLMGLYRDRGQTGATLSVLGREIVEFDLPLEIDWDKGLWVSDSVAAAIKYTDQRFEILSAIIEFGDASIADVATEIDSNHGTVSRTLRDLEYLGMVIHHVDGRRKIYQSTVRGQETYEVWRGVYVATNTKSAKSASI